MSRIKARVAKSLHKAKVRLKWRSGRAKVHVRRSVRAAKRHIHTKVRPKSTLKSLWQRGNTGEVSTVGMVASGLMNTFKVGVFAAPSVTALAAPLMGASAVRDFRRAKTWEARMDAASNFSWSLQGGAEFLKHGVALGAVGGVMGGGLEATVGAYRLATGLFGKNKSRARVIQGAIEVVAGVSWVAYSLNVAFPTNLAIFSAATAARLGFLAYQRHQQTKKEKKAPDMAYAVPVASLGQPVPTLS